MYKNMLVVISLVGLIGWGLYNHYSSTKEIEEVKQESTTQVSDDHADIGVQEGNKAPDFQLQTLDGKEMKLSDMAGKIVIINFWATWCPPCKAEMPHMQEFYLEQKAKNVEIVAVNLTNAEKNKMDIGPFVHDYELTFPVLLDEKGTIGNMYQVVTIPTSYVIDSQGIIHKKIIGPMDKEMMAELVKSAEAK